MSSKEQFKEALKRNNQALHKLKQENERLQRENIDLRRLNYTLKIQLSESPERRNLKKWWQFWK